MLLLKINKNNNYNQIFRVRNRSSCPVDAKTTNFSIQATTTTNGYAIANQVNASLAYPTISQ